MDNTQLTILIGSYARCEATPDSDVDILRIGHSRDVKRPLGIPISSPLSYIDYDTSDVITLHKQGSLFLYHAFLEGVLLDGPVLPWLELKRSFNVAEKHTESIIEYCDLLEYIDKYPGYECATLPYLAHVFKATKNIGIFKLAEDGIYKFDKLSALVRGCKIEPSIATTLIAACNCYERSLKADVNMTLFEEVALKWKNCHRHFIEEILNDI